MIPGVLCLAVEAKIDEARLARLEGDIPSTESSSSAAEDARSSLAGMTKSSLRFATGVEVRDRREDLDGESWRRLRLTGEGVGEGGRGSDTDDWREGKPVEDASIELEVPCDDSLDRDRLASNFLLCASRSVTI